MIQPSPVSAILLAAGGSTRLGHPKQLLRLAGESLVHRSARAAVEAGCSPIIVVTGAAGSDVESELEGMPVIIVRNDRWATGMGSSLRTGVSVLLTTVPDVDAAVVLLCDQPYLTGRCLSRLIDAWARSGLSIAASAYGGTVGPPCCFSGEILHGLGSLPDNAGAKHLLEMNRMAICEVGWPEGGVDVDTPEDWAALNHVVPDDNSLGIAR